MSDFGDYDEDILGDQNIDKFNNLPDDDEAELDQLIEKDKEEGAKKATRKIIRPKITYLDLLEKKGYPALREMFDTWKPTHKDTFENLSSMIEKFKYWGHTLAPWMNFKDFMDRAMVLSRARGVRTYIKKLKNPNERITDDVDDNDRRSEKNDEDDIDPFDDDAMFDDLPGLAPTKPRVEAESEDEQDLDEIFKQMGSQAPPKTTSATADDDDFDNYLNALMEDVVGEPMKEVHRAKQKQIEKEIEDFEMIEEEEVVETTTKRRKLLMDSDDEEDVSTGLKARAVESDEEAVDLNVSRSSRRLMIESDEEDEAPVGVHSDGTTTSKKLVIDSDDEEETGPKTPNSAANSSRKRVIASDDEEEKSANSQSLSIPNAENTSPEILVVPSTKTIDSDGELASPAPKKSRRIVISDDED